LRYYLSIEKNTEVFELYKALWQAHGIIGIRADTMAEGIAKAMEIEKSVADELYFIDIVADDIDFLPLLKILDEETDAPILIATSNYTEKEHHQALANGADFYAGYCEESEDNIHGVITVINSIDRRAKKKTRPSKTMVFTNMLISPRQRSVFVGSTKLDLTRREFDLLYYLMQHRGNVLSYRQIYRRVWGLGYEESRHSYLHNHIHNIRDKITQAGGNEACIATEHNTGYTFTP